MTADTEPTAALLLDEQLPAYETRQFTAVVVEASPERTYRTATTDPDWATRFRRYWLVVGPFAGLIMRRWLRLAKHDAEQAATR